MKKRVFAITAHPDDIEFGMAGTLILLQKAGCEIHYMNLANGSCGTAEYSEDVIIAMRLEEAKTAAKRMGANFYPPLVSDMEIFYNKEILAKLSSIVRAVAPDILLVPSPDDYMEDHSNTCRLAVSAAFTRSMQNFRVDPPEAVIHNSIALYHAQPHGNRNALNQSVIPDFVVNISNVIDKKSAVLADHKSQKDWLDRSQGFDAYIETMKDHSREMGKLSEHYEFAEGWRQHNPMGFDSADSNPLAELLSEYFYSTKI